MVDKCLRGCSHSGRISSICSESRSKDQGVRGQRVEACADRPKSSGPRKSWRASQLYTLVGRARVATTSRGVAAQPCDCRQPAIQGRVQSDPTSTGCSDRRRQGGRVRPTRSPNDPAGLHMDHEFHTQLPSGDPKGDRTAHLSRPGVPNNVVDSSSPGASPKFVGDKL